MKPEVYRGAPPPERPAGGCNAEIRAGLIKGPYKADFLVIKGVSFWTIRGRRRPSGREELDLAVGKGLPGPLRPPEPVLWSRDLFGFCLCLVTEDVTRGALT